MKLPEAKKGFVLLPRRWLIERSFGWLNRFRRLARETTSDRPKPWPAYTSSHSPCLCLSTLQPLTQVPDTLQGLPVEHKLNRSSLVIHAATPCRCL
jgi:hypothetical protein